MTQTTQTTAKMTTELCWTLPRCFRQATHTYSTCHILCVLNQFTILFHWHFCLCCTYIISCNYTQDTGLSPAKRPVSLSTQCEYRIVYRLVTISRPKLKTTFWESKAMAEQTVMWVIRICYNNVLKFQKQEHGPTGKQKTFSFIFTCPPADRNLQFTYSSNTSKKSLRSSSFKP
jgi:hypothetical protein